MLLVEGGRLCLHALAGDRFFLAALAFTKQGPIYYTRNICTRLERAQCQAYDWDGPDPERN